MKFELSRTYFLNITTGFGTKQVDSKIWPTILFADSTHLGKGDTYPQYQSHSAKFSLHQFGAEPQIGHRIYL